VRTGTCGAGMDMPIVEAGRSPRRLAGFEAAGEELTVKSDDQE